MAKKKSLTPVSNDHKELYDLIASLMDKKIKKTQLSPDTVLLHIGFNSLKLFHVFLHIEAKTGVEMEDIIARFDMTSIKTIDDVTRVIHHFKKS